MPGCSGRLTIEGEVWGRATAHKRWRVARKAKTFHCVEMKDRIQAQRLAEYEGRKGEFDSYIDFINARVI